MNNLRFLIGGCFLFFAIQVQAQIGRKPITPDLNGQPVTPNFQKTTTTGTNPTAPAENNANSAAQPAPQPIIIQQNSEKKEIIINKPKKGDFLIEGLAQISFGNAPLMIRFDDVKLRLFNEDNRVYRVRGIINTTTENRTFEESRGQQVEVKITDQDIHGALGVEFHLKSKNKHLSPYYGAEVMLIMRTQGIKGTNTDDGRTYKFQYSYNETISRTGIYAGGFAGLDYYLNSDFYIGTEIQAGFSALNIRNSGQSVSVGNSLISQTGFYSGNEMSLGFSYSPGIRIGYKF
ncbi:MAG: hypothetical protein NBV77_05160 [Bacteroidia bacterium]|nr:hypothetical protein [Bacteroidia bacterium]